ncbi:MAG: TolC family protein [Arcobacteraceae bacterium]|nr:TolC family protein [Arcobacteraceae bacterium]
MKTTLFYKFILLGSLGLSLVASDDENYLTLERVIELSKTNHFEQKEILEDINLEELNLKKLKNSFYPELYFDGQLGRERNLEKVENDTFGYIVWKNKLYDSNDGLEEDSFKQNKKNKDFLLKLSQEERKISVMKTFFDTNLASLYHQYLLEQLAMDAIYHNRAKDFYPTGRISDVEVLEKETNMLLASAKNFNAEESIYNNKSRLATLLDMDVKKLPEIQRPKLKSYLEREIPQNSKLLELAIKNDLKLQQLTDKLEYLNRKAKALKGNFDFQVGTIAMIGNEPQKTLEDENNRWEARVTLRVPLYDKEKNVNEIQKVQIERNKVQVSIDKYKSELSQKIDEIVSKLTYLGKLNKAYKTQFDYRNLYLEKSRTAYELDRQSDLGDAMVQLSKAEYELEKNRYEYVITYETLNLIVGETL